MIVCHYLFLMNLYRLKNILYLLLFAFFSYKLLLITLQYIPIRLDVAFLNIKQQYIDIIPWRIAFFVHVFSSMFVLLAGFTQFSATLLKKYPHLHRWIGKIYQPSIYLFRKSGRTKRERYFCNLCR